MHKEIRENLIHAFRNKSIDCSNAVILLKGGTSDMFQLYDNDTTITTFRQESYFRYLFIANIPDCYGMIDLNTNETILLPHITEASERWNGERLPMSYYSQRYSMDYTYEVDDLISILYQRNITKLYTLYGQNTDIGTYTTTIINKDDIDMLIKSSKLTDQIIIALY